MAELTLKAQIEEAKKRIAEAQAAINKAKAAGVDVSDMERILAEETEKLRKLEEAFGK